MKKQVNIGLLVIISLLAIMGVLALATSSTPISLKLTGNPNFYLFHQLLWGLLPGLVLAFIAFKIPLHTLKKWSFAIFVVAYILMLLVFVPALSKSELGATRWLDLGFASFQPSEILKLAVIIYLAAILNDEKSRKKFTAFFIILVLVCSVLFLQKDMGTLIVIFSIMMAMFFCSKTPIRQTLAIILVAVIGFSALILVEPYRMQRVTSFLHPETDTMGSSYHINQALISIGSGGIAGSGLGLSVQKFGFVPQSISDSIFAIFAEEAGFIGSSALIALFLALFLSSLSVGKRLNDEYLRLITVGIGSWFAVQALVNIGAMIGLLPLTGIPLPFISYGGSHLMMELVACGFLLSISRNAKG
ncbi:MAG: putative peptidoglycan glycosyltransferase FtsW [Candidatus Pacebacteria bacterium]|nr:putative peptidoglycan glycosyltransferase FtsW [Candidatus Paceibacterota bacterium]